MFRFLKLSEGMGSGFHKMIHGWKQHYMRKPKIDNDFDHYKITFNFEKETAKKGKLVGKKLVDKVVEKLVDKVVEKKGIKLSKNQIKILKLINEDKFVSKKNMAKNIGISTTAIDKNINKLKDLGVVNRVGPARGGYWELNNEI